MQVETSLTLGLYCKSGLTNSRLMYYFLKNSMYENTPVFHLNFQINDLKSLTLFLTKNFFKSAG